VKKTSRIDRLRYAFDNTLSRGPIALVGWLALAATLLVVLATLIDLVVGGYDASAGLGPFQVFWDVLSQALTPNPVDPNNPWQFLLVMLIVTLGSLLMVSILIGVLNASIADRIQSLRRGRSRVIEHGQVVILGWNEQVFAIISELLLANAHLKNFCIVVLGNTDKIEMEEAIREKVGHPGRARIVCRSGNPIDVVDLQIASLDTARAIIVLGPEHDDPDSNVIKTILAITNNPERRKAPYHIVAEINDAKNMEVARLVGGTETELVLTGDLIARIITQTCRQTGLSGVYTELLDFEGDDIYFQVEPALVGKTFGESLLAYDDSSVIGLQVQGSAPKLNPPMATRLRSGDTLIVISEDQETIRLSGLTDLGIQANAIRQPIPEVPRPVRTLILGWNEHAPIIINQLDNYVPSGSAITVVSDSLLAQEALPLACPNLQRQTLAYQQGDTTDRRTLDSLAIENYQHVIVLPYSDTLEVQRADARTLTTLLHLRDIATKAGNPFSIVSEMLDLRNRRLAEVTRVDDFIVSNRLVSLMLSQIAENGALNAVFNDLFSPQGSELFLKPASDYIVLGETLNFYTVVEAARQRSEVALGYRLQAQINDPNQAYGIVINPNKSNRIAFSERDRIIVLAEA